MTFLLISLSLLLAGVGNGVPSSAGVLVVVTMDNCPACERDKPVVEEIRKLGVDVRVVNEDDLTDRQKKTYGIRSYPCYLYFLDGEWKWKESKAKKAYERLK